jgi:hypothetical protein
LRRNDANRATVALAVLAVAALTALVGAPIAPAASVPLIEGESVSNITSTDATFEAQINPGGLTTAYRFRLEWGCGISPNEACPMYCIGGPDPTCEDRHAAFLPSGELAASSEAQTASLDLNSAGVTLHPETRYRYGVEATNSGGPTVKGPDQTFTTPAAEPPAPGPPSLESESVSNITATDATLEAQIIPNGLETSYQVRLESGCVVDRLACDAIHEETLPIGTIPASSALHGVSIDLTEAGARLHSGTKYAYSIEATNSAGSTTGPGGTFRMLPEGAVPTIESESLSQLTPTDATLEAQINTEGLETNYEFELQTVGCSSHGAGCELAPHPVSLPSGKLLGSFVGQRVSLDLNSAGVTLGKGEWFYTVTATNADGTATGTFHQFEAPLPGSPTIDAESTSAVTENDATLEAQVNPESLERGVRYQFQVVKDRSDYLPKFACPTEGFPAHTSLCIDLDSQAGALPLGETSPGVKDQSVSLDLAQAGMTLQPETTYHFRLIEARAITAVDTLSWEDPIVYGPDRTITTPPEPVAEPMTEPGGSTNPQLSKTTHSPSSVSPFHHRKNKRHHRSKLHRAKRAS